MTKIYTYEGNVIRKSKSAKNDYKFALLDEKGKAITCSCNRNACEKMFNDIAISAERNLPTFKKYIEDAKSGKEDATYISWYEDSIKRCTRIVENSKLWKIVELECKIV